MGVQQVCFCRHDSFKEREMEGEKQGRGSVVKPVVPGFKCGRVPF